MSPRSGMSYGMLATFALLAGCGRSADAALDLFSGNKTQTVILAKVPSVIDAAGATFKSTETLKVIGGDSGVCLVLRTGVASAPQQEMDKQYAEALGGAKLSAELRMKDGQSLTLTEANQSWELYGRITSGAELSACIAPCECGSKLTVGTEIAAIDVKSSVPLRVLGVYWNSTDAFDHISNNK